MLTSTTKRAILMTALCLMSSPFISGRKHENTTSLPDSDTNSTANGTQSSGDAKLLYDLKITPEMKTSDLDDPQSSLSKLIKFILKGPKATSEYVSIEKKGRTPEIKISIKDDSIFLPGGNPEKAQHGFRRTDVLPAADPNTTLTGTTTFYQTIRFDPKAPLVLKHGYLLASIEVPGGDHIFDIFAGSDFDSNNVNQTESTNAHTIRVRDLTTKTLFDLPLNFTTTYNFAVMVDWTAFTLTVFASTNGQPLKKQVGPMKNDPKVSSPEFNKTGEYHIQLIKFPVVDPKVPVDKRGDVPHVGLQEKIKEEHVFFSHVFVTSGTDIQQPKFGGKKHSRCKI